IAPHGIEGERVRRHVLRAEREIRTLVADGARGMLTDLTAYWQKDKDSKLNASPVFQRHVEQGSSYKGKIYGLPRGQYWFSLAYNKDLMAQAGLPVPAGADSRLPLFDGVYADIGDEQSIEQSLSTFSSHMGNIISILGAATPRSLVLLDELGAGTDPTEGSALAQAVLHHLLRAGCLTIATTHHGELKAFAHTTPGIANASVEFDAETLSPTYRLTIGLPGQSNALAIAARLGMPEEVLSQAREAIAPDRLAVESLIVDLARQREAAESARFAQETAAARAQQAERQVSERLAALEGIVSGQSHSTGLFDTDPGELIVEGEDRTDPGKVPA
ncbi:hypothetical protein LCGC14_3030290, partial [marine sediment metagenome]